MYAYIFPTQLGIALQRLCQHALMFWVPAGLDLVGIDATVFHKAIAFAD